ncbi:MAG: hypothetical protein BroJett040_10520 [Oligoflexia bacterium]|nr:MAG: hypothetical protein BroJett040_10520 [Oligoflexia bacterium]
MAAVLYFGKDDKIVKTIQQAFQSMREEYGDASTISHIQDERALEEALIAMVFDVMFFEQSFLPDTPAKWIVQFKTGHPRVKSNYILVGDYTDMGLILPILEAGWTDYVVNPPDKPLLIEKISLYSTGQRTKDRQVYSLALSQSADLAKPGHIEELSEFDCKLRTSYQVTQNELAILYSKAFGSNLTTMGSAIGRCYKSEAHPTMKDHFLNHFSFVGVTPDVLQNIRTSLRKTYVASKGGG